MSVHQDMELAFKSTSCRVFVDSLKVALRRRNM